LDAAIVEEPAEPVPAVERVADRLGELALAAGASEAGLEEPLQAGDGGSAALLPHGAALVGRTAAYLLLDGIELSDADQCLSGSRPRGGDLVERAAHMAPAEGELDLPRSPERGVTGIAIDL